VPTDDPPSKDDAEADDDSADTFPVLLQNGSRYVHDMGDDDLPLEPNAHLNPVEQPAPSATAGSANVSAALAQLATVHEGNECIHIDYDDTHTRNISMLECFSIYVAILTLFMRCVWITETMCMPPLTGVWRV